jgi:hypothetical protein
MTTRQVVIDVPEKILLAEKTAEVGFSRELPILAAESFTSLGGCLRGELRKWPA